MASSKVPSSRRAISRVWVPRGQSEFNQLSVVVITANMLPKPSVSVWHFIKADPATGMIRGIGRHARDSDPEGIASTRDDDPKGEPVNTVLRHSYGLRGHPIRRRVAVLIANTVLCADMLTSRGSGIIRKDLKRCGDRAPTRPRTRSAPAAIPIPKCLPRAGCRPHTKRLLRRHPQCRPSGSGPA